MSEPLNAFVPACSIVFSSAFAFVPKGGELVFDPVWPGWLIFLLAALFFAGALWSYLDASRRIGFSNAATLLFLRSCAIAVAMLGLLRPALKRERLLKEQGALAILVDASSSMTIRDMPEGLSRAEALNRALASCAVPYRVLGQKTVLREFRFGKDIKSLSKPLIEAFDEIEPIESSTAIGTALEKVLRSGGSPPISAILLFSDGISNCGSDPFEVAVDLADARIPVFSLGIGSEDSTRWKDASVLDIFASRRISEGDTLRVRTVLALSGYEGDEVPVNLLFDGERVARKTVPVERFEQLARVEFDYIPKAPGYRKVGVEVPLMADEVITTNNSASTFTEVRFTSIPVLYIEGALRWEYKFLKRALAPTREITLDDRLIVMPSRSGPMPLPKSVEDWKAYRVVILGDLQRDALTQEQMKHLRQAVEEGTGLAIIGGLQNFGPGGFVGTPIADLLPVVPAPAEPEIQKPLRFSPVPGASHPLLSVPEQISRGENIWQKLPLLDGAVSVKEAKPGAFVLATGTRPTRIYRGPGPDPPLLLVERYGRGRTLVLLADSTWRWAMGEEASRKFHRWFWHEVIYWLAAEESPAGLSVRIVLDRLRLPLGEELPVSIEARDSGGSPLRNAEVRLSAVGPAGNAVMLPVTFRSNSYVCTYRPEGPGDYTLKATLLEDGKEVTSSSASFHIFEEDLETRRLSADFFTLREIATRTGGTFTKLEGLQELLSKLSRFEGRREITIPVRTEVWNSWFAAFLFLLLLAAEWFWRRRLGLI